MVCMPDATPSRGGRPRLADQAKRSVRVLARLTPAEGEQLRALAARRGDSLSETLVAGVYRLRGDRSPAEKGAERAELLAAIAPIARNLNQAVRRLHSAADRRDLTLTAAWHMEDSVRALSPLIMKLLQRRSR